VNSPKIEHRKICCNNYAFLGSYNRDAGLKCWAGVNLRRVLSAYSVHHSQGRMYSLGRLFTLFAYQGGGSCRAVPEVVTAQPLASVLILSDYTGASLDQEALRASTTPVDSYFLHRSKWDTGRLSSSSSQAVGSKIRSIYHRPTCEWVIKMSHRNRTTFNSSSAASAKGWVRASNRRVRFSIHEFRTD
jgi:hypothetical protein